MPSNKIKGQRSRQYFHRAARRCNKLGAIAEGGIGSEEENDDGDTDHQQHQQQRPLQEEQAAAAPITIRCKLSGPEHKARINHMKDQIISQLQQASASGSGDPLAAASSTSSSATTTKEMIDRLCGLYDPKSFDPKQFMTPVTMTDTKLEDMWLMISKPQFKDCLGKNKNGDDMYTLGRMAFDMFRPTQLVCSIQGSFNEINIVDGTDEEAVKHVPKALEGDVREGKIPVRTYNIITAFTIEPYDPDTMGPNPPNKGIKEPIQAIMTTNGYAMPYPRQNNRYSIWFSGGSIQLVTDPSSTTPGGEGGGCRQQWEEIFSTKTMPRRTLTEKVNLFAAGLLMGATSNEEMDAEGKISFVMKRPMTAYIDLLYMDDTMRIMRSSSGAMYVMIRAPALDDTFSSLYNSTSGGSLISGGESDCSSLTMGSDLVPTTSSSFGGEGGTEDGLVGSSSTIDDHLPPQRPKRRVSIEEDDIQAIEAFANSIVTPVTPPVAPRPADDGKPPQRPKRWSSPLPTPERDNTRFTRSIGSCSGGDATTKRQNYPPKFPSSLDDVINLNTNGSSGVPPSDCLPKRPTRRSSIDRPATSTPTLKQVETKRDISMQENGYDYHDDDLDDSCLSHQGPLVLSQDERFGTTSTKQQPEEVSPPSSRRQARNQNNKLTPTSPKTLRTAAPPSRPRRTYSPMSPQRRRDAATSA